MKNKLSINLEVSLVEIIISVLIFAICGVIMLNCFAIARFTQIKANDITKAGMKAQTAFEYIKSTDDSEEMDALLKDSFAENYYDSNNKNYVYVDYYDANWERCSDEEKEYLMTVRISDEKIQSGEMKDINIDVEKSEPYPFINNLRDSNEPIFSLASKKFFPDFNSGGI